MGITISHTSFSPLSLISTIIGFISFTFTLATLLKLFWSNLHTFFAAPTEITDYLSSTKQGLLEERRHLRKARRRLKSVRRDPSHGPGRRTRVGNEEDEADDSYGGAWDSGRREKRRRRRSNRQTHSGHSSTGNKPPHMHFDSTMQSLRSGAEEASLRILRATLKDLITSFRALEAPFLKPQFRDMHPAHWNISLYPAEKPDYRNTSTHYSHDDDDDDDDAPSAQHLQSTHRLGAEYKTCSFAQRWLWVRRKAAVTDLNQVLSRVEVRRTAHEVGEVLGIVLDIGRDVEDVRGSLHVLEGRLGRVVGVRRVD